MARKQTYDYKRIPLVLKAGEEFDAAFALKRGMEDKHGRTFTWAALVRRAFTALAKAEKIKCQ